MKTTFTGGALAVLAPVAFLGFLFALPAPDPDGGAWPSSDFAVVGALVFDGEAFQEDADVWIAEGRVRAVGPDLDLPDSLPRVRGRGRTLLPGLIDGHVHTFDTARADALRYGVTTLLDQFTHPSVLAAARAARETVGESDGADLFSAGFLATTPGGHGTEYGLPVPTLRRPDEAAAWVDARLAEGSDWIKIVYDDGRLYGIDTMTTLGLETVAALIDAAHARDRKAVVHVARLADGLAVLEAGADGLVHVWLDEVIGREDAARIAASGAFVIPTLSVDLSVAGDRGHRELLDGPAAGRLSSAQRASLGRSFPDREGSRASAEAAVESVRRLYAAGVTLLAGTDAPNPGTAFGISLHRELRLLAGAGLPVEAALAAATSAPADAFDLGDRGRLVPGRIGDLLLVEGDIRNDLGRTLDVAAVWKDGRPVGLAPPTEVLGEAPPAEGPLSLGDFDDGERPAAWASTTDEMMGGASEAELEVVEGVLVVRGEVKPGFAFPWAGAAVGLGRDGGTADLSSLQELRFRVRGGGVRARVMLITAGGAGPPPTVSFPAGEAWAEQRLALADFGGADLSQVQAIAFVAGPAPGRFELRLDDVEVR